MISYNLYRAIFSALTLFFVHLLLDPQKTEQFKKEYALRSGIEGTISQGIRGFALRDCRYIGLAKTHLQHILTAVAINLNRIVAWLEGIPLAKTRKSHFALLAEATV